MIENNIKDWEFVKLGEVCKITYGKGLPTKDLKEKGYPVFGANGLIGFNDKYLYEESEVLISCRGAYSGKINLSPPMCFVTNNSLILEIINKDELDRKFLFHILHSVNKTKLVSGTAQPQVTINNAVELILPLPPLSEQQEIVAKIEELLSELDKGKEQLEIARQQLKIYRQAVLKWAFEGKLTNPEVKEGRLREGWRSVKLGEVSKVSGGLTKDSKRENLDLKLPFLRVANVYFNCLNLAEVHTIGIREGEIERVKLKKNDLLFVEGNGSIDQIGRVALWDGSIECCVHQNHLIKSRLNENVIPKYALYFFCSTVGRSRIKEQANSTSGLHTLNLSKISNLEIIIPLIEEQNQIVQEIESRLSVCDKVEETIGQGLQQAETLRQSILRKAFEGELL